MTASFCVRVVGYGNEGLMINPGVTHQIPHVVEAAVTGVLGWIVKYIFHSIQREWQEVKDKLSVIEKTTVEQASNHLHTIEANTSKTNELLEKVVDNQI